jgi:uncharacterized damage-inducible protein DinB
MSARAQTLADQFEQANHDLIALVEQMDEATWQASHGDDTRTFGVIAHHVASSHRAIMRLVLGTAKEEGVVRPTPAQIDERAAAHAVKHADCTREETIILLRDAGTEAAEQVQSLIDAELDQGAPLTAGEIIERILIGHTTGHTSYIREALEAPA